MGVESASLPEHYPAGAFKRKINLSKNPFKESFFAPVGIFIT
jgi:hypothetical protein